MPRPTDEYLATLTENTRQYIIVLEAIVTAAWAVRREQNDYNPCPDLVLRANCRDHLHKLLDVWKAAEAAKRDPND